MTIMSPSVTEHTLSILERAQAGMEWVVDVKHKRCETQVDRETRWGNPYKIPTDGDRETVIIKHHDYLMRSPVLLARLPWLAGRVLGCHCDPKLCHGGTLGYYANHSNLWREIVPLMHYNDAHVVLNELRLGFDRLWQEGRESMPRLDAFLAKLSWVPGQTERDQVATQITRFRTQWMERIYPLWDNYRREFLITDEDRRFYMMLRGACSLPGFDEDVSLFLATDADPADLFPDYPGFHQYVIAVEAWKVHDGTQS